LSAHQLHSLIVSKLDYCNSFLAGCSKHLVDKLQRVLNSAVRVIFGGDRREHIVNYLIDFIGCGWESGLHSIKLFISSQGTEWHGTKLHRGLVYQSHLFLLASLSAQRPVETSLSLVPDFALATVHSLSPVLRLGTVCRPTFGLHQHYLLSKIGLRLSSAFTVVFCSLIFIDLIPAAYAVRRPCSDFTGMFGAL